ncbi:MAG: ABC transporter permease [Verrucomicrobia bacterium]|nr:ABC transporter permease [Verrucomicrobiota bacterium]
MFLIARTACSRVGKVTWHRWHELQRLAAILGTLLWVSLWPRHWRRTVRQVFARQLLFTGVESVWFTVVLGLLVGMAVVMQAHVWLGKVGLSPMAGPLLVVVVARELGPVLANIIVIVRSGSAMATELGLMKVRGEVRVLEAQGLDPLVYLVMPRALAMVIATFGLAILFIAVAFLGGYFLGRFTGGFHVDTGTFLRSLFRAMQPVDLLNVVVKSVLPALLSGVLCCTAGLDAQSRVTQIPAATKAALGQSLAALFLVAALVSLITYA